MKTAIRLAALAMIMLVISNDQVCRAQAESENKPDVEINVNREYDEDGKLIRFDSSYVSSLSSIGAGEVPQELMDELNRVFGGIDAEINMLDPFGADEIMTFPFPDLDAFMKGFDLDMMPLNNAMFLSDSLMQLHSDSLPALNSSFEELMQQHMQMMQKLMEEQNKPQNMLEKEEEVPGKENERKI